MRPDRKKMQALLQRLIDAVGDCEDTQAILAISKDAQALLNKYEENDYPDIVCDHFVWIRECLDPTEILKTPVRTVYSMPCVKFEFKAVYDGKDKTLKRIIPV